MFAYDSENDEYNEIFEENYEDSIDYDKKSVITAKSSFKSSKFSIRSYYYDNFLSRIISKTGRLNVHRLKVPNKNLNYFRDLGNTILSIQWRWILFTLCSVNFASFFLFGILWMWLAYISGDFEDENAENLCVVNTKNLTGYILLSIETMLTIGYGYRYPTEKCMQGWILPLIQALVGVGIQGALVSAVYVKIAKPFTKNTFGLFGKKAVICLRDGKLCLIIRMVDVNGKVSVGTNLMMYYVDKDTYFDDERSNFYLQQMKIEPYGFLIFPLEIIHVIDSKSPLWNVTPFQLLSKRIEIIVVAEGSSIITGQTSQNKISYINSDILWGHRFAPCVHFSSTKEKYIVNYKEINKVIPFSTPLCSAQQLNAIAKNL